MIFTGIFFYLDGHPLWIVGGVFRGGPSTDFGVVLVADFLCPPPGLDGKTTLNPLPPLGLLVVDVDVAVASSDWYPGGRRLTGGFSGSVEFVSSL